MQVYPSGTAYLTSGFPVDKATPPPAVPNHTPAQQRFRKQFLPIFMSLKQPLIPGIWGSWDPVEGQPKEPESDWPQYNVADSEAAPHAQQQSGSAGNAHASVPSASVDGKQSTPSYTQEEHANYTSTQDSNSTPANPRGATHSRVCQSQTVASPPRTSTTNEDGSNHIPPPQPQTQTAQTTPPSVHSISTGLCLPAPPSLPAHLFTAAILPPATTSSTTEQHRYTSPPPPPKHFNPSTDLGKDKAIKRVISATQNNNDNGPIWGVASRPPITFDGDEDYSGALTGGGVGVEDDTERRGLS